MADSKHPKHHPPPIFRSEASSKRKVRDFDNPTAQFPIGAMYREAAVRTRKGRGASAPSDEDDEDATELLDLDEEDTDEAERPSRSAQPKAEMRYFALMLAAAAVLGLLAALGATAAVLYR